jgi:hypothetical protein
MNIFVSPSSCGLRARYKNRKGVLCWCQIYILVRFWRQDRVWGRLSFYVARSDSDVLALLAGLAPDTPAQKHFPDVGVRNRNGDKLNETKEMYDLGRDSQ